MFILQFGIRLEITSIIVAACKEQLNFDSEFVKQFEQRHFRLASTRLFWDRFGGQWLRVYFDILNLVAIGWFNTSADAILLSAKAIPDSLALYVFYSCTQIPLCGRAGT